MSEVIANIMETEVYYAHEDDTIAAVLQTLVDKKISGKSDKTKEDFETDDICPRCGGTLVKRSGKYGTFMGCSNYPKCRYIKK